jgi:hypothetical protein
MKQAPVSSMNHGGERQMCSPHLRAAIERVAEAEHRTVAGQIRYWVIAALAPLGAASRPPLGATLGNSWIGRIGGRHGQRGIITIDLEKYRTATGLERAKSSSFKDHRFARPWSWCKQPNKVSIDDNSRNVKSYARRRSWQRIPSRCKI